MSDVNQTVISGRLVDDPKPGRTTAGKAVSNLRLASNQTHRDRDTGELHKRTTYVTATVFGGQAESCNQHLRKGAPVLITGRLEPNEWTKPDGQEIRTLQIHAHNVNFLPAGPTHCDDGGPI
jgi:single-strand DNA-binding protein